MSKFPANLLYHFCLCAAKRSARAKKKTQTTITTTSTPKSPLTYFIAVFFGHDRNFYVAAIAADIIYRHNLKHKINLVHSRNGPNTQRARFHSFELYETIKNCGDLSMCAFAIVFVRFRFIRDGFSCVHFSTVCQIHQPYVRIVSKRHSYWGWNRLWKSTPMKIEANKA